MADTQTAAVTAETTTPAATTESVAEQPALTPREQLLAQYQALYGVPAVTVAEPMSGTQPTEPAQTTAAEPTQAVTTPPPTPPPASPELMEVLRAVNAQLAELQARVPKVEAPAAPTPPDALELLRNGQYDAFVQRLTEQVREQAEPVATSNAVAQALELFRIENETTQFLQSIRTANPEIAELERLGWLDGPIQQKVLTERQAGRIKNPADYVRVFKEAVNGEVEKARNFLRSQRAVGKQEAMTTKQEVLRSTPLVPNAIDNREPARQDGSQPQQETVESYFARRKAEELRRKGLASG